MTMTMTMTMRMTMTNDGKCMMANAGEEAMSNDCLRFGQECTACAEYVTSLRSLWTPFTSQLGSRRHLFKYSSSAPDATPR